MRHLRLLTAPVVCLAWLLAPLATFAQDHTGSMNTDSGRSWLPFTSQGYIGASIGEATYDFNCVSGFACDDSDLGFKVYVGGKFRDMVGLELAYVNMGEGQRAGGDIKAHGVNLSLIGNIPIGQFSIFGKVGTTYGWTETSTAASSGASSDENDFGLSYGAGIGFDIQPNWGVRAEWERHRFEFASGDDAVDLYTVGVNFKF